ncbi:MAG: hypothetical protein HZB39_15825 [Planctomycetes bacterium]|nr:hypothetical protein [Planctomycetota bacterium]
MPKPSKPELTKFRRLLEGHLSALRGDVGSMRDEALRASEQDNSVDHLADQGTDNYDQGFLLGLIENEEETIQLIVDAIDRIDGKGEWPFGACPRCLEECQEPKAPKPLSGKSDGAKASAAKGTAKSGAAKTAAGKVAAGKTSAGKASAGKDPASKAGAAKTVASKSGKAAPLKGAKSASAAKAAPAAAASTAKTAVAKTALARPSPAKVLKAPADDPKAEYWIPIDRLEYVPWARYCVRHQEEAESREIA